MSVDRDEIHRAYLLAACRGDYPSPCAQATATEARIARVEGTDRFAGPDDMTPEALVRWYGTRQGWSRADIARAVLGLRRDIARWWAWSDGGRWALRDGQAIDTRVPVPA
jgi:hypothetical protein